MGFFDLFRKKKEQTEVCDKEIKISELSEETRAIEKEKFSGFYEKFAGYNKEIVNISKEIEKTACALEKAKVRENVDDRLMVRINSAKENLINKTKLLCKNHLSAGFDFSSFKKIEESLEQMDSLFSDAGRTGAKYAGAVALVHKKESVAVSNAMKKIISLIKEMKDYFENNSDVLNFKNLEQKSEKLKGLAVFRKKIVSEKEAKEKEKQEKEQEISLFKTKINEIESSEEYSRVKTIEGEIENLTSELNSEKISLRNWFSDFSKAMNKFVHDTPLGKEEENLVESYLAEPFDALDSDPELEITKTLKELKKAVDSGNLGLDERIKNKTSGAITDFLEKDVLLKSLESKKRITSETAKKKKELEQSGVFEANAFSLKLKDAEKQMHDINTTLELQEELLKKNSDGIEKLKKEVSELFLKFRINAKIFNN